MSVNMKVRIRRVCCRLRGHTWSKAVAIGTSCDPLVSYHHNIVWRQVCKRCGRVKCYLG